jgi:two-component system response regulator PilR (NtrC family)
MTDTKAVLIIDDQIGVMESQHRRAFARAHQNLPFEFHYCTASEGDGYSVVVALNAIEELNSNDSLDLILLDLRFGQADRPLGVEILRESRRRFPLIPVLILSSLVRDVAGLGICLEEGAIGFVAKTATPKILGESIMRGIEIANSHVLLGNQPPVRELRRQVARLSPYDQIPVLILGERGTGKELVARHIHHNGPRSEKPLIAVNCAAISSDLIESELFGAEKGSYTGATHRRTGFIERADGGLLFLDEVGELPCDSQAKLLRVLQGGKYRRVGDSGEELTSDFQLICATNANVEQLLREGRIREDFYDRIAAVIVRTPPLRDYRQDIGEIAATFLRQLGVDDKKSLDLEVVRHLEGYDWPGNVRQLQRVLQEAIVRSEDDETIRVEHLPDSLKLPKQPLSSAKAMPHLDGPSEIGESHDWVRERLRHELEVILTAKARIQAYKGQQWKAEFMRSVYPHCKAANAKGFADLIRRLTQGPWGDPNWQQDPELKGLIEQLDK